MENKELVKKYRDLMSKQYSKKLVKCALDIATCSAEAYPEEYYTDDFKPHVWVVAAVCEALKSPKFWKSFNE